MEQEVRWSGAGEMQIDKHHSLWSGPGDDEPRLGGVGLVLNHLSVAALCTLASSQRPHPRCPV